MSGQLFHEEYSKGKRYQDIAKEHNTTKNAVAGAIGRWRQSVGIEVVKRIRTEPPKIKYIKIDIKPKKTIPVKIDFIPKPSNDWARFKQCLYIGGKPGNPEYCGYEKTKGPYCDHHHSICYKPNKRAA